MTRTNLVEAAQHFNHLRWPRRLTIDRSLAGITEDELDGVLIPFPAYVRKNDMRELHRAVADLRK